MKMLLALFSAFAGLCAVAAPVYTVTLPNGTTNTLDEAFSNGYVTSDDAQETPSYGGLCTAADLHVAGGGRLEINKDLKSAGYTGEVHVVAGAILRITANGALGDTAHGTFVADGATLENECLDTSGNNKLDFAGESLSFAGTGVCGLGALIARTPTKQERNGVWGGTKLTMTGDAMISTVTGYQDFPCNSSVNSLDMNGHTLTVRGFQLANGLYPGGVCLRPVVTNPGHIVITNCGASINDAANLGGGAANTFTLAANATLELFSYTTAGKKKWTLIIPESNEMNEPLRSSQYGGVWDGPILADRGLPMYLGTAQGMTNNTSFLGKVYVKGDFSVKTGNSEISIPSFTLASDENEFLGGFRIRENVILKVNSAAALACATAVVEKASSVVLNPDITNYRLPVLVTKDNVTVTPGGGGRWEGLVKEGLGELSPGGEVGFRMLDLKAGTLTLNSMLDNRVFYAGLSYGFDTNFVGWAAPTNPPPGARYANTGYYNDLFIPTNKVVIDFSDVRPSEQKRDFRGGTATYWTGYIMNPEPTNVTWRFGSCIRYLALLRINGKTIIAKQPAGGVGFGNAELNPGANTFVIHTGSDGDCFTYNPNNCTTWTNGYAFAVCKTSTTSEDSADFEPLADPGDGSVLRCAIEGTSFWDECGAAWSNSNVMVTERFAASVGTTLNLANRALCTAKLEGCPTVTKAETAHFPESVEVTGDWTVDGVDLASGAKFDCEQTIVFAEGSTVSITNGRALAKSGKVVIAESDEAIVGLPTFLPVDRYVFEITKSDDGKKLYAEYVPNGMMILLR